MVSHKKMEFEGKDVAEAISKACKTLNVSQEEPEIEVLKTGTAGIFGLCRQKARLRVALKKDQAGSKAEISAPQEQTARNDRPKAIKKKKDKEKEAIVPEKEKKAREKAAEKIPEPVAKEAEEHVVSNDLLTAARADLARILELMGFPSEVSVETEQENITVRIKGEYENDIIGQNGKTLDSLQYLLRKIIGKKFNEKAIISIDAGDFRAARTEELKQLGLELAAEVKKNGKTKSIPSLNPSERRVVHLALQNDKDIRSRSVGEGLFKKILIYRPGSKGKKGPPRKKRGSRKKNS